MVKVVIAFVASCLLLGSVACPVALAAPAQQQNDAGRQDSGARLQPTPEEALQQGLQYLSGDGVPVDYARAAERLQFAAGRDNGEAQYHLAKLYALGLGVMPDIAKAVRLYKQALGNRVVKAATALGDMYDAGVNVKQDFTAARSFYEQALELGDRSVKARLVVYYAQGLGGAQDTEKAQAYAADLGDAVTLLILANVENKNTPPPTANHEEKTPLNADGRAAQDTRARGSVADGAYGSPGLPWTDIFGVVVVAGIILVLLLKASAGLSEKESDRNRPHPQKTLALFGSEVDIFPPNLLEWLCSQQGAHHGPNLRCQAAF